MCTLHEFSVLKSNLFIRALLLDRILVTEKTTRTPRVHLVVYIMLDKDNSESSLHQMNQRRKKTDQQKNSSNSRKPTQCRWCGGSRFCRRHECPARDSYCNKCHIKGHFEKVCRQDSTRRINKRQPLHKLDDDEDEGEDDDVTSVYSFKTLYNLNVMESEHIRPLWISTTATSQVHKVSVEVDTGAACNVMPVYLFSKNLWKQTA